MSILIKGLEMPDMCSECEFCGGLICPDNIYTCDCPSNEIHGANITRAMEEDCRHPDCPLIPVPPHGRLIDADALCDGLVSNHPVAIHAKSAPTIIPAEEGEL